MITYLFDQLQVLYELFLPLCEFMDDLQIEPWHLELRDITTPNCGENKQE